MDKDQLEMQMRQQAMQLAQMRNPNGTIDQLITDSDKLFSYLKSGVKVAAPASSGTTGATG